MSEEPTAEQQHAWDGVTAQIDRVRAYDRVVVSSPVWNWSIPDPLKIGST